MVSTKNSSPLRVKCVSSPWYECTATATRPSVQAAVMGRTRGGRGKWACSDSNREPRDYESRALTVELQARGGGATHPRGFTISFPDPDGQRSCFPLP